MNEDLEVFFFFFFFFLIFFKDFLISKQKIKFKKKYFFIDFLISKQKKIRFKKKLWSLLAVLEYFFFDLLRTDMQTQTYTQTLRAVTLRPYACCSDGPRLYTANGTDSLRGGKSPDLAHTRLARCRQIDMSPTS